MRLCSAFVDNLTLILRTAFVAGALFLVQDLDSLFQKLTMPEIEDLPAAATAEVDVTPSNAEENEEPLLTEGVKHAFNCTFTAYRNAHYDECVEEPSRIYLNPQADPDDTGYLVGDDQVLYARL